jgi:hypothetical protein
VRLNASQKAAFKKAPKIGGAMAVIIHRLARPDGF